MKFMRIFHFFLLNGCFLHPPTHRSTTSMVGGGWWVVVVQKRRLPSAPQVMAVSCRVLFDIFFTFSYASYVLFSCGCYDDAILFFCATPPLHHPKHPIQPTHPLNLLVRRPSQGVM